ncbi:VaFE repeat-containing surface-anchored protein [Candidatus Saccharibacteria bacterium]|nr:VaFE repeat-containing surface-anchored protein [Candidatus Saccharibacteria bacterium]
MLAKTKETVVGALTASGERVHVKRDEIVGDIFYSSPDHATVIFEVTNQSRQTFRGFCRNPNMRGPDKQSNPLYASVFSSDEKANITKLMAYLVNENNNVSNAARAEVFRTNNGMSPGGKDLSNGNIQYGFAHAVMGYVWESGTDELLAVDEPFVATLATRVKNLIDTDSDVWVLAKNYLLYGLNGYPRAATASEIAADPEAATGYQDVVWIEGPIEPKGNLKIKKCMKGTGNECLAPRSGTNFNGIKFEVYNNTGAKIYYNNTFYANGAKVTDGILANGNTELTFSSLPVGSYKVKEVNGNTWYDVDTTSERNGTVTENGTVAVTFYNSIKSGGLIVYKKDKETNSCSTLGKADFAGNKFEVRDSSDAVVATKTMAKGDCSVSFTGLPYGDYTVKEITAGNGYLRDTSTKTVTVPPTGGGNAEATFSNQVMRGDVKFVKVDENNRPMENIPFMIRSKTTGEEHRVVTNSNGIVNTAASFIPHTTSTNGYDSLALSTITHSGFGTWFNGSKTITTTVDNNLGALPYDDYEVFELECNHNQLCRDIGNKRQEFTISSVDAVPKELETFKNDCGASISTSASDNVDRDKFVEANATAKIKDAVTYQANPGLTLTIKGKLMDKSTGQSLKIGGQEITKEETVTVPASGSGTKDMIFSLNASEIAGKDIVVYEELYFGSELIAEHKNINDANQTVTIVKITTSASDNVDNDKFVEANATAKIKDHVNYCAKAGASYTIKGKLMDKATREALKIGDQEVTAEKTVTVPASGCGEVDLVFSLDASTIAGKDIVVYEVLYEGDKVITKHEDLNDADQTVTIVSISTKAVDNKDEDKFVEANSSSQVKDVVEYCAKRDEEFILKSQLVDKKTGEALALKDGATELSTTIKVPKDGCGSEGIIFYFDSTGLAGNEFVVTQELYYGDDLVAVHDDLENEDQMVTVISLSTVATDNYDKDKYIEATEGQKVRDVVEYCVRPGRDFTIKGVLMNKATGRELLIDGQKFKQEAVVNSENGCGSVVLTFPLDATFIAGIDVVAFEYMYYEDELVLSHNYFDDVEQTTSTISLWTYATNKKGDEKIIVMDKNSVIKDKIKYSFKTGAKYTIEGILMNKATGQPIQVNGKTIRQSIEIDASKSLSGEAEMSYTFDSTGLNGVEIVIFDYVYEDGELILSHTDVNNANQTVKLVAPPPNTGFMAIVTGNGAVAHGTRIAIVVGFAAMAGYVFKRKRSRSHKIGW